MSLTAKLVPAAVASPCISDMTCTPDSFVGTTGPGKHPAEIALTSVHAENNNSCHGLVVVHLTTSPTHTAPAVPSPAKSSGVDAAGDDEAKVTVV